MALRGKEEHFARKVHKRHRRSSAYDDDDCVRSYDSDSSGESERAYARPGPSKPPHPTPAQSESDTDKSWKQRRLQRKEHRAQARAQVDEKVATQPSPGDAEGFWARMTKTNVKADAAQLYRIEDADDGAMQRCVEQTLALPDIDCRQCDQWAVASFQIDNEAQQESYLKLFRVVPHRTTTWEAKLRQYPGRI